MPSRYGITALVATVTVVLSGCLSAPVATAPIPTAAAPAAAAGPMTLPEFLGLAPVCAAVDKHVKHKLAFIGKHFPCVEPQPPLLPLGDPANLASPVPAIAAAAEIKADQDLAPQKIKALQYLATIGCGGCYAGVEDAFLAGLEDCTEEVRFEAAQAIYTTAGSPCIHCNNKACCSPKIRQRLTEIAFGGSPCPTEPSPRVRRMARLALTVCGAPAPVELPPPAPREVIPAGPPIAPAPPAEPVTARTKPSGIALTDLPAPTTAGAIAAMTSKHRADADATVANIVPSFDQKSPGSSSSIVKSDGGTDASAAASDVADVAASGVADADVADADVTDADVTAADVAAAGVRAIDLTTVSDEELDRYYTTFRDRYRVVQQVRWESVSASCEDFASQDDAVAVMLHVQRLTRGENPTPPAAFHAEHLAAHRHDWTRRSEIASPAVAAALFTQPVGSISDVMTDGERLILVRVVERRFGEAPPLATIADRVRKDLLADRAVSAMTSETTPAEPDPSRTSSEPAASEPVEAPIPDTAPVDTAVPHTIPADSTVPDTAPVDTSVPDTVAVDAADVSEPHEKVPARSQDAPVDSHDRINVHDNRVTPPAVATVADEPAVVTAMHENGVDAPLTLPGWADWTASHEIERQSFEIRASQIGLQSLGNSPATTPIVPDVLSLR